MTLVANQQRGKPTIAANIGIAVATGDGVKHTLPMASTKRMPPLTGRIMERAHWPAPNGAI